MKIIIASVGRLKDVGERDLFERYRTRFNATGKPLALGPLDLREFPESRNPSANLRRSEEAARLVSAVPAGAVRVVLDGQGHSETSQGFARRLASWRDGGATTTAFLIGGPDGHGDAALTAADLRLSLGAMTLPHGLARVILAEQLYRATTILAGHPYHRE